MAKSYKNNRKSTKKTRKDKRRKTMKQRGGMWPFSSEAPAPVLLLDATNPKCKNAIFWKPKGCPTVVLPAPPTVVLPASPVNVQPVVLTNPPDGLNPSINTSNPPAQKFGGRRRKKRRG